MQNQTSSTHWIVYIILAVAFTFVESVDLYKDMAATSWPIALGNLTLTYSPAPQSHILPEYGPIFHPLRTRELVYSYEVDGKLYTSSTMSFGFTLSENKEITESIKGNHAQVKVYFNPSDPNEAVLMPGPKAINIGLIVLGLLSLRWIMQLARPRKDKRHGKVRDE